MCGPAVAASFGPAPQCLIEVLVTEVLIVGVTLGELGCVPKGRQQRVFHRRFGIRKWQWTIEQLLRSLVTLCVAPRIEPVAVQVYTAQYLVPVIVVQFDFCSKVCLGNVIA